MSKPFQQFSIYYTLSNRQTRSFDKASGCIMQIYAGKELKLRIKYPIFEPVANSQSYRLYDYITKGTSYCLCKSIANCKNCCLFQLVVNSKTIRQSGCHFAKCSYHERRQTFQAYNVQCNDNDKGCIHFWLP